MHPFVDQVQKNLAKNRLLTKASRVVGAVSGGADSMALLHALCSLRETLQLQLFVAHLDHGLRVSSAEDARFVQDAAKALKVPVVVERLPVCELCEKQGWSLEEGARHLRYQFLEKTAQKQSAVAVAVAHTADDQAETVLMRFLRGSGLAGLGAIPVKRALGEVSLIRPLLSLWRSEVIEYLKQRRIAYREDESNRDKRFVRNRIRHELIPLLQESFNPKLKESLVQLAEQAQADDAYLQAAASRQWKRTAKISGIPVIAPRPSAVGGMVKQKQVGGRDVAPIGAGLQVPRALPGGLHKQVVTPLSVLKRQPLSLRRQLIRRAVRAVKGDLRAFEFRHWTEIEQLIESRPVGSIVHLPGGIAATKQTGSELVLAPEKPQGYTNALLRQPTLTHDVTKG